MSFWDVGQHGDQIAVIDSASGVSLTYAGLQQAASCFARLLPANSGKDVGLILASNKIDCVAAYLAALQRGDAVLLFNEKLSSELVTGIVARYQPDWIFGPTESAVPPMYRVAMRSDSFALTLAKQHCELPVHDEVAVLLSTSGSTGSPKLVRLSRRNVQANAASIAEYLGLTSGARPITSLPMAYSYGLSVLNSHLLAGATLILTNHSITQRQFWDTFNNHGATSFAGVPYMYQVLLQLRLLEKPLGSLKTLTQAGGRLDPRLVEQVHEIATRKGWTFFVMYGQTEATARISYVPPDRLHEKQGSIGVPIPKGTMRVDPTTGELIYRGPNVMMGYAEDRQALAAGDELGGELRTGDLVRQDEDGFFYITGRLKRFIKIYGNRFNLDELESILRREFHPNLACFGRDDQLCVAIGSSVHPSAVENFLFSVYQLNPNAVRTIVLDQIPHNSNGKVDYLALASAAGSG